MIINVIITIKSLKNKANIVELGNNVPEDGLVKLEVRLENETIWFTQQAMAELFKTTIQDINLHIKNVIEDGELLPDSVIKESLITAADGKKYTTGLYKGFFKVANCYLKQ